MSATCLRCPHSMGEHSLIGCMVVVSEPDVFCACEVRGTYEDDGE